MIRADELPRSTPAKSKCGKWDARNRPVWCTLPRDHKGAHKARYRDLTVATWTDEEYRDDD